MTVVDQSYHPRPFFGRIVHEISVTTYFSWCSDGQCSYRRGSYCSHQIFVFGLFQSATLYELIPNSPHTSTNPYKPSSVTHSDGIIDSVKTQCASQLTGTINNSLSIPTMVHASIPYNSSPTKIFELNVVQYASSLQSGGKKKTKNKSNRNNNQTKNAKTQTQPPAAEYKKQWKMKFPCLICVEDHCNRDFPHHEGVSKFVKGNSQPTILTNPFPKQ